MVSMKEKLLRAIYLFSSFLSGTSPRVFALLYCARQKGKVQNLNNFRFINYGHINLKRNVVNHNSSLGNQGKAVFMMHVLKKNIYPK